MRNLFSTMFWFSFNAMYLGRNNGNISETKKRFLSQRFLKIRKVLLDMRKGCLIMSNFYLAEIRRESNNIDIVRKKNTQNEQLYDHFEYFFSHRENQKFAVQGG